jgi:hypothetical protein
MGVIAGLTDVAADSVTGADGANTLVGKLEAKASELADEATNSFAYALFRYSHIADLVVSDWGKLQTAAQLQSEWQDLGTDPFDAVQSQIQAATLQWFYSGLLPLVATTYNLGNQSVQSAFHCTKLGFTYYPFDGTPSRMNYGYAVEPVGGTALAASWWVLGRRNPSSSQGDGQASLPASLSTALIEPFDPDFQWDSPNAVNPPAGFFQPWLYRWTFGGVPGSYPCD